MSLTQLWKARLARGGYADVVSDRHSKTIRAADGMPCGTVPGARRNEVDDRRVRRTPARERRRAGACLPRLS
ncbi:hypothetical protein AB0G15_40385 [Streptosporangium sp. NPDC023825]|uniref:hypothetical protein n=1 Tax=Streptosporangium sp. NPDC023825 TaxID=3154909 RepID=UPI003442B452